MPRKAPGYRLHKASGNGYTEYQRQSYYFGPYMTPESLQAYARFIAELAVRQKSLDSTAKIRPKSLPIVCELLDLFFEYAERRYSKNGKPTSELAIYRAAASQVHKLYAKVSVSAFGPVSLDAVRQGWVSRGLSRKTINQYTRRIVRIWKWGVSQQIVPAAAWQALSSLEALRAGQGGGERSKVKRVTIASVNAVEPFVSRQIWAMIQFQLWTACRPDEACQCRVADIDKSHKIWEYRPGRFKTQHHEDSERIVFLGPHAQSIISEWAASKPNPEDLLWQPFEARKEWLAARGSARVRVGKYHAGAKYTVNSYGRAIERACEKAFECPVHLRRLYKLKPSDDAAKIKREATAWRAKHCWSPNQLRHAAATRIRSEYGIEIARIILGHSSAFTTEIYAEEDREKARRAVGDSG